MKAFKIAVINFVESEKFFKRFYLFFDLAFLCATNRNKMINTLGVAIGKVKISFAQPVNRALCEAKKMNRFLALLGKNDLE